MNILQMYRRFEDSGPGTQPLELSKYFRDEGHNVIFVSSGGKMVDEIRRTGFTHIDLATLAIDRRDPLSTVRNVMALRRIITKYEIEVVHGHNAASTFCAYLASFTTSTRPRIFQSVRGLDATRSWRNQIYHIPFAHLFAVCGFTREWLLRIGVPDERVTLTYNGVDTQRFNPFQTSGATIRKEFALPDDAFVIGHVGAFSGDKGQHLIVQAVSKLREQFPEKEIYALFVGDGHSYGNVYYEETRRLAQELDVAGRCVFAGFRRDIPQFQAAFDVYCHPSTFGEMFPNAIVEAMAMAKPWVGSDLSGLPELANVGKNGILVPPGDLPALVDALRTLLTDQERRSTLSRNSHTAVLSTYAIERVGDTILSTYEAVSRDTRRSSAA